MTQEFALAQCILCAPGRCNRACAPETNVQSTLDQRGSTHGDFGDNATVALQIRDVMRSMKPHWSNLSAEQRLALEEIALKIGRICSGGNTADSWHDIAGYATLGEKACVKK